jgi:hypothetical protein
MSRRSNTSRVSGGSKKSGVSFMSGLTNNICPSPGIFSPLGGFKKNNFNPISEVCISEEEYFEDSQAQDITVFKKKESLESRKERQ